MTGVKPVSSRASETTNKHSSDRSENSRFLSVRVHSEKHIQVFVLYRVDWGRFLDVSSRAFISRPLRSLCSPLDTRFKTENTGKLAVFIHYRGQDKPRPIMKKLLMFPLSMKYETVFNENEDVYCVSYRVSQERKKAVMRN